jgi:hypothetical protein
VSTLLERFKKSSVEVWEPYRTDLERVAIRTLEKPEEQSVNITFIIDEQSIVTLYLFATIMQCKIDNAMQLIMIQNNDCKNFYKFNM